MSTETKLRRKRKKVQRKVESTQARLSRRLGKLRALESRIARLQQQLVAEADRRDPGDATTRQMRPVTLIFNPKCGGSARKDISLDEIVAQLRRHGFEADVKIKTCGKDARRWAKDAVAASEDCVVVAAGDGTVGDVAAQLVGSKTVLGILPVGTMNNLARSLGIPLELDKACALLAIGSKRSIDVGHILVDEKPQRTYFLETAGLGVSAIAFPAGQAARKGQLHVLPRAIRKLFDHKPRPVQIVLDDGEPILTQSQLVTVSNAPLMGLNFLVAPEAKMDDGLLDVAVYEGMGKTKLLEYFMATRDGKRVENSSVRYYRARKIHLISQSEQPVHADKDDLAPQQVVDIEVIPQALSM
ncbi:MAG: diacylglycerol kinase family lipid kinase, partial [Candidatus Eremiobacteraeota bacterium]|nr:diacylglycerol kinase family lipid kinase [Candidatus Eremiobacteraeota bacterium]